MPLSDALYIIIIMLLSGALYTYQTLKTQNKNKKPKSKNANVRYLYVFKSIYTNVNYLYLLKVPQEITQVVAQCLKLL